MPADHEERAGSGERDGSGEREELSAPSGLPGRNVAPR
jgi:hypothetical protein